MVTVRNQKVFSAATLLIAVSCTPAFTAEQSDTQYPLVILEKVSINRIESRQKFIATMLDTQSSVRTSTVTVLSATALLALVGSCWYAHEYYIKKTPSTAEEHLSTEQAKTFEELYYERRLAHFEETQTVKGVVKHGIRNGFGYAIATIATVALLASFEKLTNISLPAIKKYFYPTTADLYATQEQLFKESFDYLQTALQNLATEQSRITTQEQLDIFKQWRSMLCTGVETSMATLVKSVEDFAALSIELATRACNTLPKDHPVVIEFSTLLRKIDTLVTAINSFSDILESTINAPNLATLNHNRMQVSMHFKNTIVTAREALHHVVMLVDAI